MGYKILAACSNHVLIDEIEKIFALSADDFLVSGTTRPQTLLSDIKEFKPDIILFDTNYAHGSWAEVISSVKLNIDSSGIPLIALADFSESDKIQALFHAGVDDFISIPFTDKEIIQRVKVGIQRNRLMDKLRVQSSQLRDISVAASSAGNSIVIVDENGYIIWVNDGFERLYECNLGEFKKTFGDNLFSSDINRTTYEAMKRCRETGDYVVYDSVWRTPSGMVKYIQTSLTPILDSNKKFSKIVVMESDISDLVNAEKELEEKHDHLLTLTEHLEQANTMLDDQRREIENQKKSIEQEKARSEELLRNILPWEVARSLQKKGIYKPKKFKEVSVLFADFIGFSRISSTYEDVELFLDELGSYFERFDEIASTRFLEKIKTIGDCYMCAGGLPRTNRSHPYDTVIAALEMQWFVELKAKKDKQEGKQVWRLRIGIHTGSVIAGVIGKWKFAYDIWGDTVNVASRMETSGEAGTVNVSETTYQFIKDYFQCTYRGKVPAKNIGEINMYFVERILPQYSDDEEGLIPNAVFKKILSSF